MGGKGRQLPCEWGAWQQKATRWRRIGRPLSFSVCPSIIAANCAQKQKHTRAHTRTDRDTHIHTHQFNFDFDSKTIKAYWSEKKKMKWKRMSECNKQHSIQISNRNESNRFDSLQFDLILFDWSSFESIVKLKSCTQQGRQRQSGRERERESGNGIGKGGGRATGGRIGYSTLDSLLTQLANCVAH